MDSSIKDLIKELNESDTEVLKFVSPTKADSVHDETFEEMRYNRSVRYINRAISWKWRPYQIRHIEKYKTLNKTVVEVTPTSNESKGEAATSIGETAASG